MVDYEQIKSWIATIVAAGGGGAFVAYGIFKLFGTKWLDNKFAERLLAHKHEQDKEIQRLRAEIDSTLSGTLKLQERDFQILPQGWEIIHKAYSITYDFTSNVTFTYNLDRCTPLELEEFFSDSWLKDSQKMQIKISENKADTYRELYFWHQSGLALRAIKDMQLFFDEIGIFLPLMIFEHGYELVKTLISATTNKESEERRGTLDRSEQIVKEMEKAKQIYDTLKQAISDQLRSHTKLG